MVRDRHCALGFGKRRNVDQSTRTIQLLRWGLNRSHQFVLVVLVEQDDFETFAKFKLLSSYASRAAAEAAEIHLGWLTDIEIEPNMRSAVGVGRRILSICHASTLARSLFPHAVP